MPYKVGNVGVKVDDCHICRMSSAWGHFFIILFTPLTQAISASDIKKSHLCDGFMVGWVAVFAEGVDRTGQDGTGQAQHEHISRTAGGTRERGMCASEACISKSDLSCGCLWWCPHGRALRYGTWPLSGLSVWPFLFAGSLRRWPAVPTSSPLDPNPRPGSLPGTGRPPFPSPTGPGASEIHSWREGDKIQTEINRERGDRILWQIVFKVRR